MVKPASVQRRINAFRTTHSANHRAHKLENAKLRLLKRLKPSKGSSHLELTALAQALGDKRSPYSALIVKNVTPSAFHHLKPAVAGLTQGTTFAVSMPADLDDDALSQRLALIQRDMLRVGKEASTLLVYWEGEGEGQGGGAMMGLAALLGGGGASSGQGADASESGEDTPWSQQVASLIEQAHKQSPRTKIVIVTPRTSLEEPEALKHCEVQDALGWGTDMDALGRLSQAESLARQKHLALPRQGLEAALHDVPYEDLSRVFQYASVLQRRRGGDALPQLQAAVAEYWQQEPSDASNVLRPHLWDARQLGFNKSYFGVPMDVCVFVDAVRNHRLFGGVNATLPHVLVLDASEACGTATVAGAIAGELGATFVRLEDVELVKMLNSDKGGLEKFLDAANTYGRERNCPVVMYVSQLEAVLTLGMQGLHAIGKKAGREHLVIVAAADDLTDGVRSHLQPHVHMATLATPQGDNLVHTWRYYLTQEHPSHTLDNHALARVARASTGFHVEEVRDALVHAGKLAFGRKEGPVSITEADVLKACDEASEARKVVQPYFVALTGDGLQALGQVPTEVAGFVELLKHYDQAKAIDRNASKSLLLHGAHGVGKLNVAKAVADEMGAGLFAFHKAEILQALSDEEVGLQGLMQRVNTWAQQQNKLAVVYLGDIESSLGAGANAEESVGFNPVAAKLAKLAQQCGNHPAYKSLILVAGTADSRVIESSSLPEAFQLTAQVRSPDTQALVELFRRGLATDHAAHGIDDAGLARIAATARAITGFNAGAVQKVLNDASRRVWLRPSTEPRRLEVADVLAAIDAAGQRAELPSFYT